MKFLKLFLIGLVFLSIVPEFSNAQPYSVEAGTLAGQSFLLQRKCNPLTAPSNTYVPVYNSTNKCVDWGAQTVEITSQTSLPTCNAANAGKVSYYKPSTAPGFMVSCIDNGGLYELVPMNPPTAGFVWFTEEFLVDTDAYMANVSWWSSGGEDNHPGLPYIFTPATGTGAGYMVYLSDASTSSALTLAAGDIGWTTEWIVRPDTSTSVRYLVGMSSEVNQTAFDEDLAILRYDTGNSDTTWIAVTRDNTTETETTTDTGVTLTSNNWYRLIIVRSASDIKFYVGVNGADVSLVATHTTNLPNTVKMSPYIEVRESVAAERDFYMDYFRFSMLGIDR